MKQSFRLAFAFVTRYNNKISPQISHQPQWCHNSSDAVLAIPSVLFLLLRGVGVGFLSPTPLVSSKAGLGTVSRRVGQWRGIYCTTDGKTNHGYQMLPARPQENSIPAKGNNIPLSWSLHKGHITRDVRKRRDTTATTAFESTETASCAAHRCALQARAGWSCGAPVFLRFSSCHRSPKRPWPGTDQSWVVITGPSGHKQTAMKYWNGEQTQIIGDITACHKPMNNSGYPH